MRDLFKLFIVGIFLFFAPQVFAGSYKVLVLPDNIVTESVATDAYIYDTTAEFFADSIVTILNTTDFIKSPTVSETRTLYKKDASVNINAKALTSRFKTSYNIDYGKLKKLAKKSNARYVLLLTSYIDAENYVLRRTFWDFLNIPGATVVDPAYKISTYAVLVDTDNNQNLWSNTYYKTISVCENRIITRGPSPQTEQLQKIRDYSRYISPQIAQAVQENVLPEDVYNEESKKISYDLADLDNIFTKKYRHYRKETFKAGSKAKKNIQKLRKHSGDEGWIEPATSEPATKLEVKATPVKESSINTETEMKTNTNINTKEISNKTVETKQNIIKSAFRKTTHVVKQENPVNYYNTSDFDIKKTRKNNLYGTYDSDKPQLRDYYVK